MGLFDKGRLVVLSAAHSLLDKAIDMNSIGAVKQQVRDLESSRDDLRNMAAEAEGYIRTVTRERDQLQAKATAKQKDIDFLLTDDDPKNDENATAFQVELNTFNQQVAEKNQDITDSTETSAKLNQAVAAVDAQHSTMVAVIERLESLDRTAKAKATAVKTVEMAERITNSAGNVDIDDIAARIRRNADVQDVKFDHAFEGMQDNLTRDQAFTQASVDIAKRKAELAAKAKEHLETQPQTTAAPA